MVEEYWQALDQGTVEIEIGSEFGRDGCRQYILRLKLLRKGVGDCETSIGFSESTFGLFRHQSQCL